MFLEAVTVCVGYADYLSETLPYTIPLLDRWVIVTSPADTDTQDLCRHHNLECLVTGDLYRDGNAFDKARAVDRGMSLLSWRDWVLHLDADIVLPPHTRTSLGAADLDTRCLYGCDRVMVEGKGRWIRLRESGFLHRHSRSHHFNVCFPGGFAVGARWADVHHGYCPVGFFQLMHRDSVMRDGIRQKRYSPNGHNDAARTDVQFALLWDRNCRVLLPEVVVLHLSREHETVGANWSGRVTATFSSDSAGR